MCAEFIGEYGSESVGEYVVTVEGGAIVVVGVGTVVLAYDVSEVVALFGVFYESGVWAL